METYRTLKPIFAEKEEMYASICAKDNERPGLIDCPVTDCTCYR